MSLLLLTSIFGATIINNTNVGETMINHPFGNGLYHLFMVMIGGWFMALFYPHYFLGVFFCQIPLFCFLKRIKGRAFVKFGSAQCYDITIIPGLCHWHCWNPLLVHFFWSTFFCMEVLAISGAPEEDDDSGGHMASIWRTLWWVVGGSILGKKPEDQQIHCIFFGSVWP